MDSQDEKEKKIIWRNVKTAFLLLVMMVLIFIVTVIVKQ